MKWDSLPSLVAVACLLLFSTARAATYDPDLRWRTIKTDHFRIHFHQSEEQLAEEFSLKIEDIYDTMINELQWAPQRRTEVVLIDRTDSANGYAMSVPYNAIVIYVTAPQENSTLSLYEDWATSIATHEFTHTLHIDTNHGVARIARAVIGRIASTNRISPRWMVEGLATFEETRKSSTGRGRSPTADMIKRTAVIEGKFPPLGNLDGIQADPPGGNLRYLFGQDFIQFTADHYGEDIWTRWIHIYGSSVPYFLPGKAIFGDGFQKMYNKWEADLHLRYEEQINAMLLDGPETTGRLVSDGEASCIAPSFSPDGEQVVWSCLDRATGSAIWTANSTGEEAEILLQDRGAKNFTWRSDSKAFVYAGTHVVNRFNTWSDVYLHVIESERTSALTNGARARDPDFSPDGSLLLMVTNRAQNNQLERLTVDKRRVALTSHTDHTQYATPRFSPDGQSIAVSVWKHGRRDLWIYDLDGSPIRRLTMDAAVDRDPHWSSDGQTLYFSSDRSGIPNIYAIDVQTERLWQVTNVPTGAVTPSVNPDQSLMAYQQYSENGWDVYMLELNRDQWIDRGLLPQPLKFGTALKDILPDVPSSPLLSEQATLWRGERLRKRRFGVASDPLPLAAHWQAPGDSIDSFDQGKAKDVFGEEEDYPFTIQPRRYTPFATLVPRYWVPYVGFSPYGTRKPFDFLPFGFFASASTGASDPLRHYGWNAGVHFRSDAAFVGGYANFTINRWIPVYSFGVSRSAVPSIFLYTEDLEAPPTRYWDKRHSVYASVNYPYTFKTWIFARYSYTTRQNLDDIPANLHPDQLVPIRGAVGTLQGGWRYSWGRPTSYSISIEDGRIFSLVGGIIHPYLGAHYLDDNDERTPFTQFQLTSEIREYIVNPWVPNHVLAMRLAGGMTIGANKFMGNYQLGGSIGDSAFYVTPDEFRMLRGYPNAADAGDMYWLTGLEYRFPIVRMDRGWGVIPAFIRAISGNVFIDAGNAFTEVDGVNDVVDGTLVGVGAEIRVSTFVWWSFGLTARLGFAMGLTEEGIRPIQTLEDGTTAFDPRVFYFQLGGSF